MVRGNILYFCRVSNPGRPVCSQTPGLYLHKINIKDSEVKHDHQQHIWRQCVRNYCTSFNSSFHIKPGMVPKVRNGNFINIRAWLPFLFMTKCNWRESETHVHKWILTALKGGEVLYDERPTTVIARTSGEEENNPLATCCWNLT
jgi:hypothetical protein